MAAAPVGEPRQRGLCRCCMSEGTFKSMEVAYSWRGCPENYADMLLETFNVAPVQAPKGGERLICGACVFRLRDACSFRRQLRRVETSFLQLLHGPQFQVKELSEVKVEPKLEASDELVQAEEPAVADEADTDGDNAMSDPDDDAPLNTIPQAKRKPSSASTTEATAAATSASRVDRPARTTEVPACRTPPRQRKSRPTAGNRTKKRQNTRRKGDNETSDNEETDNPTADAEKGSPKGSARGRFVKTSRARPSAVTACVHCGKTFPTARNMRRHVDDMHQGLLRNKCAECPLRFRTHMTKLRHMLAAHGVRCGRLPVYRCKECGATFDTSHARKEHAQAAHATKDAPAPVHCPRCPERFGNHYFKRKHMRLAHGVVASFPCGACEKVFCANATLLKHQRSVHMMERDYACAQCDARFYAKKNLEMHMIKHNAVRSHECDVCHKRFPRRNTLLYHRRIHTGDKRMVCGVCGQAFVQSASLKYHMTRYHPEV